MIRALVVDDSHTARRALSEALTAAGDITVVGTAADPYEARELIVALKPDVITLDLEMPRLDGMSFLERLMRYHPMPVVVISSLTRRGSEEAIRALELGAVDVLCKPGSAYDVRDLASVLGHSVRAAARAKPRPWAGALRSVPKAGLPGLSRTTNQIIAIGASTGGTQAIRSLLERLPPDGPGVVIAQHMPPMFTSAFAQRLDQTSGLRVREAQGAEEILPGLVYVAPGNRHLKVSRNGARYRTVIDDGPPVNYHRPSIDVLFDSVAISAGRNAVGLLLTGMGDDGARGLLRMRQAGARTFAQDEISSVVYGMPKVAMEIGAAERQGTPVELAAMAVNAAADQGVAGR